MEIAEAPIDRVEIFGKARRLLLKFVEKSVVFWGYLLLLPLNLRDNTLEGIGSTAQVRRCEIKQRD
jgi:hypothetical protein